jgi:hypothetical protein
VPTVVVLGPQRLRPTLVEAVDALRVHGPVAAVTAGWQEREDEIDELSEHLRRPVRNLRLFRRGEDVFERDPELWLAFGDFAARRRRLQDLYRRRLAHALEAVRELMREAADADLLDEEVETAIEAVRDLDDHHRERVRRLRLDFDRAFLPLEREAVRAHRTELAAVLSDAAAFAIAGGHVEVLLDRLRLFDVLSLLPEDVPVFAWSAGAMVASEQVVLFHDSPPQGAGHAEVHDAGLGLFRHALPLPGARRRLRLDDRGRVALFARRFAPARCLALDEGSRATFVPVRGWTVESARELLESGAVEDRTAA